MGHFLHKKERQLPAYLLPVEEGVVEKIREKRARQIADKYEIIAFKGGNFFREKGERSWRALKSDDFARIAYRSCGGGITSAQVRDLEHWFRADAPDYSDKGHLIAMGEAVWDMRRARFVSDEYNPEDCVYQTQYEPGADTSKAREFLLSLAKDRPELADDIIKALAPLLLTNRPTGVIWFWGNGANGKSSLIDAVYRLFGPHLVSMTISHIEDGRDTPVLNGALGNVVRESSETRVEDAERYKALGTHESFLVHKFHSQDSIEITGDLHHIFNANNIPTFADKSGGARRRTEVIPFDNVFKDDIHFNDRTFTSSFLAGLLSLLTEAAEKLQKNGGKYNFSQYTLKAKGDYADESNTAEAYMRYLEESGVEAFTNYVHLKMAYESWCALNGDIALGLTNLRRAVRTVGGAGERTGVREGDKVTRMYIFEWSKTRPQDLVSIDNGFHVGLKVAPAKALVQPEQMEAEW